MKIITGQNLSASAPLVKDGKRIGVPLEANEYIDCNLTNREPEKGAVIVNCNLTIREYGTDRSETEFADVVYGHFDPDKREYVYLDTPKTDNIRPKEGDNEGL